VNVKFLKCTFCLVHFVDKNIISVSVLPLFRCSLCDYSCTSDTVLHNHVKFRHKDDFERRKKMNVPRHGNRRTLPAEEREYLVMRNNGGNNEIDLGQPQVQAQGAS
jgi:hypothetical protein